MLESLRKLKSLVSPLSAFFMGTALACCAYGLLTSILAVRMADNGVSTSQAGIVLSLYYAGFVLAALSAYRVINKAGHIRAFGTYISVFSIFALLHYFSNNYMVWGALRFAEGYCMGSATMCLESWLNCRSSNKNRGIVMAIYMITTYAGSSTAQLMLNIPDESGVVIYMIVSILFSLSMVPISLTALPTPNITPHGGMSVIRLYKITPVGVIGCLVSGIMVGTFYTLSTIYLKRIGMDIHKISLFMFFGVLGGLLAQFPIGRFSDKRDRRSVMLCCSIIMIFAAPIFMFLIDFDNNLLPVCALLLGSLTLVTYPVCVSHVNDLIEDDERTSASGMLILLQGSGLAIGPVIISAAMQHFGNSCYFLAYSVVSAMFVAFILRHMRKKPDINYISVTPTEPVPLSPTMVYSDLAEDKDEKKGFVRKRL